MLVCACCARGTGLPPDDGCGGGGSGTRVALMAGNVCGKRKGGREGERAGGGREEGREGGRGERERFR
jgi:hypothetical protein